MGNLDFSHGGNIYQAERKYKRKLLDFSANINPLGLPSQVKETIYKNFNSIVHYPDPEAKNITRGIAEYWGIKEENVLVGNGSVELIYLIVSAFKPKVTFIPVPTFSEYERAAKCVNSKIQFLRLKEELGFRLQGININKAADILFLCSPNNPTGNLILTDYRLIKSLSAKLIVIDEAFMDFVPQEEKYSFIRRAQMDKKIIVLRTCTKFFALAGLRIGYLVAHRDIVKKLKGFQVPWSVNFLAQIAAEAAFADKEYIRKTRLLVEKEREFLFDAAGKVNGLTPFPSVANFLLIRINDKKLNSPLLSNRLIQAGILVRDCVNFRGLNDRFIRIAVRSHNENIRLVKALQRVIA